MNATAFVNTLFLMLSKYWPEELDANLKPKDSAGFGNLRNKHYDFIIVGGGAAGSVLGGRLSENPNWDVAVIEAGEGETFITDLPAANDLQLTLLQDHIYNYTTEAEKHMCLNLGGHCHYIRGRGLGGGTVVNGMMYVRGNPSDYDEWGDMGCPGWNYKTLLPYFLKSEDMTIPELQQSPYHSTKGPWTVGYSVYNPSVIADIVEAGKEYGLPEVDYNGEHQIGFARSQFTLRGPTRCSTAKAFLDPARNRPNLYIFKNTVVKKLIFDEKEAKRVIGVSCVTNGEHYNIHTKREVILSAGAIDTPKILMLSGIGPKDHLEKLNIKVVEDLPVGQTFLDHPGVYMFFKMDTSKLDCCMDFSEERIKEYAKDRTGPLGGITIKTVMFLNSYGNSSAPNIEIIVGVSNKLFDNQSEPIFTVYVSNLKPLSYGTVQLKSSDYRDIPSIRPNYFEYKEDMDVLVWGIRETLKYMESEALKKYSPEWVPGVDEYCKQPRESDAFIECYIQYQDISHYHVMGTTRMGQPSDKLTVVDPSLKVHNTTGLRVIDGGIAPTITRGNIQVPVVVIAEKGADLVKNDYM